MASNIEININGLVYRILDSEYAILIKTEGLKRPVRNIPSEIEYEGKKYPVHYVNNGLPDEGKSGDYVYSNGAFNNDYVLSSVSFPEGIKAIKGIMPDPGHGIWCRYRVASGAFLDCKNLKDVIFSNSIKEIGTRCFYGCEKIQELYFGEELDTIGEDAFGECSSLEHIDFNDKIKIIGTGAFRSCGKLKNVSFPESLESIGISAFKGCSSMTEVNIPASVKEIRGWSFADSGVKVVNIYSEEINIAEDAFPAGAQINFLDKNSAPKHIRRRRSDNSSKEVVAQPAESKKQVKPQTEVKEKLVENTAPATISENISDVEESGFILKKDMAVDTLANEFKNRFGSVLRIYEGRSKAEGNKTLEAVGLSSEGTFQCRGSLTVGSFIQRMSDEFGLKVKVYTCDEWVAVLDGLTLTQSGKVKKNAVKADMENMIAYQRETAPSDEFSVVKNPDGSYTVSINGEVQTNAKGAMRQIAGAIGFEYDPSWTTQQFGSKLSKALKESTATAIAESR